MLFYMEWIFITVFSFVPFIASDSFFSDNTFSRPHPRSVLTPRWMRDAYPGVIRSPTGSREDIFSDFPFPVAFDRLFNDTQLFRNVYQHRLQNGNSNKEQGDENTSKSKNEVREGKYVESENNYENKETRLETEMENKEVELENEGKETGDEIIKEMGQNRTNIIIKDGNEEKLIKDNRNQDREMKIESKDVGKEGMNLKSEMTEGTIEETSIKNVIVKEKEYVNTESEYKVTQTEKVITENVGTEIELKTDRDINKELKTGIMDIKDKGNEFKYEESILNDERTSYENQTENSIVVSKEVEKMVTTAYGVDEKDENEEEKNESKGIKVEKTEEGHKEMEIKDKVNKITETLKDNSPNQLFNSDLDALHNSTLTDICSSADDSNKCQDKTKSILLTTGILIGIITGLVTIVGLTTGLSVYIFHRWKLRKKSHSPKSEPLRNVERTFTPTPFVRKRNVEDLNEEGMTLDDSPVNTLEAITVHNYRTDKI